MKQLSNLSLLTLVVAWLATPLLVGHTPSPATAAPTSSVPTAVSYLVKDINVSFEWLNTIEYNGQLFFVADDGVHGEELWRSDGTTAGTVMVKDFSPDNDSAPPYGFHVMNGYLYLLANDGTGADTYALWRTDGTTSGTVMVAGPLESPEPWPIQFPNLYLFVEYSEAHGTELWRSDGTAEGTYLVKDIYPGSESSYPYPIAHFGGAIYMAATTPDEGTELWRTDGTTAGTLFVKDIYPGPDSSYPGEAAVVYNNLLYFDAYNGTTHTMWRTDGTAGGTVEVISHIFEPYRYTLFDGDIFFFGYHPDYGREVWRTNGTLAGTTLLKDIHPGTEGSSPSDMLVLNGALYFLANDGTHGRELWRSDSTTAGTNMVLDLDPGDSAGVGDLLLAHNRLYFAGGNTPDAGNELWQSDGTAVGTTRITDINPGPASSYPYQKFAVGDLLFFSANNGVRQSLWAATDPQEGPTFVVNTLNDIDDGLCTISHCSLREAIQASNANPGMDTITFAPSAHGTITPNTALPHITDALHLSGPGVGYLVLNGGLVSSQSLLRTNTSESFILSGMTIWQGGGNSAPTGGALTATGGGSVTINSVRFNENRATSGGAIALYSGGVLQQVEFYGNQATAGDGGAIVHYNGVVTMYDTSFNNNTAANRGGAVYSQGNFLNIYTSEFNHNSAVNGGAIYAVARPTIDRSRLNGNQATEHGGALYSDSGAGFTGVYNSLFTQNSAGGDGTAVYLTGNAPAFNHQLIHNTLAAPERQAGTAIHMAATGTLNLSNNIIANNHTGVARVNGTVNEDYNLFYDNEVDRNGVLTGADSFNGNPLFVSAEYGLYELLPGSPAVDMGTPTAVDKDIYNHDRPQGAGVDKGFFELPQAAVAGPGFYPIGDTGVGITVTQAGNLAYVQLVWIPLDHPSYDEESEENHPASSGGYWKMVGVNSAGQTATGFSLTLSLPYEYYHTNPSVCRWDGAEWDCGRDGLNSTHVWRHNVTAFSDWAIGEWDSTAGGHAIYLPLVVR